jgi:small conductance mechanosensitive channel
MDKLTRICRTAWACCLLLVCVGSYGQSADSADQTQNEDMQLERLDAALKQIALLRPSVELLTKRYEALDEKDRLGRTITDVRLNRTWNALVQEIHAAARLVLDLEEAGADVQSERSAVKALLPLVPVFSFATIDRLSKEVRLPADDQPATEQAAIYARIAGNAAHIDSLLDQVLENLALQKRFGLDVGSVEAELNARLEERAATTSAFLDVASNDVNALQVELEALPGDEEITARLGVANELVAQSADVLRRLTTKMEAQGLDTTLYKAQLIAVTGEITKEVLDVSVLRGLVGEAWADSLNWLQDNGTSLVFSTFVFLAILFVTLKLAGIAQRLITTALERSHVRLSQLLGRMIVSITRGVIIVIGVLMALSQVGISLGPLLAGLGIAGFVVGFALQDTLSNFASGMMILFYRPFDVGDVVEAGGVFGKVGHMSLVNTTILTFDNQTLIIPNSKIWGDVIKNLNSQRVRRVDMVFGIGYGDDIPKAEEVLTDIVRGHDKVLDDPEPIIRLHELGESSVNFVVRPWVRTGDYWDVYWDITRAVKMRFDAEGITIPFPQRDVHFYPEAVPAVSAEDAANWDGSASPK